MAKWNVMHNARVMMDVETGALGIKCGGEEIIRVAEAAEDNDFVMSFTTIDGTNDYTCDKTYADLAAAMAAGKNVVGYINGVRALAANIRYKYDMPDWPWAEFVCVDYTSTPISASRLTFNGDDKTSNSIYYASAPFSAT